MKHLTFTAAAALAGLTCFPFAALAEPAQNGNHYSIYGMRPYIGAEYQYSTTDVDPFYGTELFDDSYNGGAAFLGLRDKYFGLELGYMQTGEGGKNIAGSGAFAGDTFSTKSELSGITLDLMGYMPVDNDGKFEIIGSVGGGYYMADVDTTLSGPATTAFYGASPVTSSTDDNQWGGRVGIGAQYFIMPNLSLRAMARYTWVDFTGSAAGDDYGVEDFATYSAGVAFHF
ncbi:outer membrane beta-barrel protein [bacterium]|nr:outer membrane beta-barrel protein [bacterium]